ncbi:MAG: HAMP domain-containing protein [archaeon]
MSIKIKLTLIIIGTIIVVSLPSVFFIYQQNSKILTEHLNADMRSKIDYSSQLVNFYMGRVEDNLSNLAKDPIVLSALETKNPATLKQVSEKMTTINDAVGVIENIGLHRVVDSRCVALSADKYSLVTIGNDFSDRDYCKGIIKTKSTYISSSFISVVSKNIVLGMVVPVNNSNGQMVGYVLGVVDLKELRGYLWDLQENSKIELLDRYGVMFLNTAEKIDSLDGLPSAENIELGKIEKALEGDQKEGYFIDDDNFVGYKFNGFSTIIFEKSMTDLSTLINTLNITILLSILVAIILMIIVIYLFTKSISDRISNLSKISQEISSGKFTDIKFNEKDIKAKDEIGILAKSFNNMALNLKDLYENLEKKVKERTEKLEESENILKKTLDDSERVNKLMVGRELEMIKLKKEMAELKEKK